MSERKHDDDFYSDSHEEHIDEKWLISYSDMMTLLFGFFVMMYVLSMSSKVKIEEALQQISQEGFSSDKKATDDPKPVVTNMTETTQAADDILVEFKKKEEKKRKELEDTLIQTKAEVVKNEEDLKMALEKIKKMEEIETIVIAEKAQQEKKIKEFEEKIKELEIANVVATEEQKQVSKSKHDAELVKRLKKNLLELESNIKLADTKAKELAKENAMLKQKIDDTPKIKDDDHFMMVFVRWETEKHDIDMIVEDPKGNVFNYKKRILANVPGEFVVDSTQGPGVESWVTNKTIEGIYKITFKFYNQYGNKKNAILKPSVFNNLKVDKLPDITLNFAQHKEKTVSIKVAKDGQFTVLP